MSLDILDYNQPPNDGCDGKQSWVRNQQYWLTSTHFPVYPSILFNGVHGESFASFSGTEGRLADWDLDALRSQLVERVTRPVSTTPPATPNDYDRHIVPVGATGRWGGHDNKIALAVADPRTHNARWIFRIPIGGEIAFDITDPDPANHQWIIWNQDAVEWRPFLQHALASPLHTDVDIDTPLNNQWLKYDGSKWVNSFINLSNLADVLVSGLVDGQVLTWDNSLGFWVNQTVTLTAHGLDDHTDVVLTSPTLGDILYYNGTSWVNSKLPLSSLDFSTATSGQVPTFNGTTVVWATPGGGGGGGTTPELHGIGITYANNVVGAYVRKDRTTPEIRWDSTSGTAYYSTAGMGFGNIIIPSGYTKAIFYAQLNIQDEVNGYGLSAILRGLNLAAVRKNGASWDYMPHGLFGPGNDVELSSPGGGSGAAGPWLNRVNYLTVPGVFRSKPMDVVAAEVWAISMKWRTITDLAGTVTLAGSDNHWTVSGGPGNNQPAGMTAGGTIYTLFEEWGVFLYA